MGRIVGLACVLGLGGAVLGAVPRVLELEESFGLGALFSLRGPLTPPESVVVVSITGAAADALEQSTEIDEWPRELHATLIDRLSEAGAAAIAFDITFLEPRQPQTDAQLAAAVRRAGNVLLAERLAERSTVETSGGTALMERRTLPLRELEAAALGTAPFVLPRVPVRVGQFWTFVSDADATPSLPALALQAFLLPRYSDFLALLERARPGVTSALAERYTPTHDLDETMRMLRAVFENDRRLAADVRALLDEERGELGALVDLYAGPSSRFANYYGPPRTIRAIPYDRALDAAGLDLAGKMVFVGFAETARQPDQQDYFYSVFSQRSGIDLSGVEVGATAFANLLDGTAIRPLPIGGQLAWLLAFGALAAVAVARRSQKRAMAATLALVAATFGGAYYAFAAHEIWLPLVVPFLQVVAAFAVVLWWHYGLLAQQRERMHKALGYYVPPALARRLVDESVAVGADGRLLHGTCLFTDAERYTAVAETLRPDELAQLMNEYYAALFGVVAEHGGEISDTAGDSMVAIWASVRPDAEARERACRAAIAVLHAVAEFNRAHPGRELPTRVGLESGELLLGNIGAEQRYEYRAIGDMVNTASRIQELNRVVGTRVLLSSATLGGPAVPVRDIGSFVVRGKRLPIHVYEPIEAALTPLDGAALKRFAAGLSAFRSGEWRDARMAFDAVLARASGDGPSLFYRALADKYEAAAPERWSGAVELS